MNNDRPEPNPHDIIYPSNDRLIYWATVRYTRHWISNDGPESMEVQCHQMTTYMLRRIAIRYNVMRGIVGKTDEDDKDTEAQKKLCEILNKAASKWPTTLVGRSKRCVRVTEDAIAAGCFRNFQISAVTKFMWFLKPDNWTSFDQYAAKGYNKFAPRGSKLPTIDTESKMIAFYKGLKDRQVTSIWSVMQEVIDKGRLKGLPAPRIFDSFLMEKGRREEAIQSNRIARYSLALLPKQTARDIHRLGSELQSKFGSQIEVAMTSKIQ